MRVDQSVPGLTAVEALGQLAPPGGLGQGEEGLGDGHLLHCGQSKVLPPAVQFQRS